MSIETKLNTELTNAKLPTLINIGSCNLHKVHNAFGKGIASFGKEAEDLALKLFYWFKHSAARREDYRIIQVELDLNEVVLLHHVPTHWLTPQPAVVRVLSQWPAIICYFKEVSSADKSVEKNEQ